MLAGFFQRLLPHKAPTEVPVHQPSPEYASLVEQQATIAMKALATQLMDAANALDRAAESLKFAGKAKQATLTKQASTTARKAAEGWV